MKKNIAILCFFVFFIIIIVWVIRGYKMGRMEIGEEKKKEINGKVVKIYKPEDAKIINIIFSNGIEYAPSFFGLNNLVEVGDSIYKPSNSLKFLIYKKGIINDSISFEANNNFYK